MLTKYQYFDYVKRMQIGNEKVLLKKTSVSTVAKNGLKQVVSSNAMHFYILTSL